MSININEAEEFEMVMKGRVARQVEDLDDDTLKAIANSEVPADYVALNDLIKDWTPCLRREASQPLPAKFFTPFDAT